MRGMFLAAGALLVAAVAGLMTAEAQPGRVVPKVTELKKFEAMQKEFNGVMNGLIKLGRGAPGVGSSNTANKIGSTLVNERVWRDIVDKTIYKSDAKGVLTLAALQKAQKDFNGRVDLAKKTGKLTELDRGLLKQTDLSGVMKTMGRSGIGTVLDRGTREKVFIDRR